MYVVLRLKVNRVIKFTQETWLKLYIDINIELKQSVKNDFEKDFCKKITKM